MVRLIYALTTLVQYDGGNQPPGILGYIAPLQQVAGQLRTASALIRRINSSKLNTPAAAGVFNLVTLVESNWNGIITEFKRIYALMRTELLLNSSPYSNGTI